MPASGEQLVNATPVVGSTTTTCARIELAQDTLRQFGFLRIRATGGSMLPAIAPGDLLTFRACAADEVEPGQILLVRRPERLVAHRMMERQAGALLTRGDALASPDAPVAAIDVLGVLIGQHRGGKSLHAGGRHWLRRQHAARWLIQRINLAHRLFARIPALAALTA